jgi:hypothetical protein
MHWLAGPWNRFLKRLQIRALYTLSSAGIFKQSMGARNRVGIGLWYRLARLHILAELVPWNRFLGSLKDLKFGLRRSRNCPHQCSDAGVMAFPSPPPNIYNTQRYLQVCIIHTFIGPTFFFRLYYFPLSSVFLFYISLIFSMLVSYTQIFLAFHNSALPCRSSTVLMCIVLYTSNYLLSSSPPSISFFTPPLPSSSSFLFLSLVPLSFSFEVLIFFHNPKWKKYLVANNEAEG